VPLVRISSASGAPPSPRPAGPGDVPARVLGEDLALLPGELRTQEAVRMTW